MSLQDRIQWEAFLQNAGIPANEATTYANIFVDNRITHANVHELTKEELIALGITIIGDIKNIQRHAANQATPATPMAAHLPPASFMKTPAAKLPQLNADMTHPQFRKFKTDWGVFKRITNIPDSQLHAQLYNTCDDYVQNCLVNTITDFFTLTEIQLLETLEGIVTKKSNPTVHRLHFSAILQSDSETIKDYLIRLKSSSPDCEFSCPDCHADLQPVHIRDQFIKGVSNDTLQTDILAKASHLQTLDDIVKHAEAFEAAQRDHTQLQQSSEVMAARTSDYQKNKTNNRFHKNNRSSSNTKQRPCSGCGSLKHGGRGSNDRATKCPAWGTVCGNCKLQNHFTHVCRGDAVEVAYSLVAKVSADGNNTIPLPSSTNIGEIPALLSPSLPRHQHIEPITMNIFPDSGASICLAGPRLLDMLNLHIDNIIPCSKKVTAVGGSKLTCSGWLPITFKIGCNTTNQPVYICNQVDRFYLSKNGCIDLNIISPSFPLPMPTNQPDVAAVNLQPPNSLTEPDPRRPPPSRPLRPPYAATTENIPKLEQYLLHQFQGSAFNNSSPFPAMSMPPAHIHLNPDAQPSARHTPIPVPLHWKDEIKASLDKDVARGIIAPVPIGTPVVWCSPMVITAKKDGRPRRTVDLQKLNSQCRRETHHCQSPFQLACQIPPNTKKTILDAVDGYHAVELDNESQHLTTFITEWGRYMYLRLPQGFLAAGDAYTRRYDEVIKDTPRKIKVVDDTLLYDDTIEESFFHTWDYLVTCANNGIVISKEKFKFCRDTIEFAGLTITANGISPSPSILAAIAEFPSPKDLTGARSWFGLVNQIAWAYSISPVMQPFRELVKCNTKFSWNETLQKLFSESKALLLKQVEEGIRTFDTKRRTCLQTDWSKDGIGYLLLQQYCNCPSSTAPICCPDGWKLVFAGSRFTSSAESRYSPTEGEALSVAWSLDNAKMFVLGCQELIVVTDHKPLLGILKDRDLSSIPNPRLSLLKEKTFRYHFSIQHCPGKWHRGPDAVSRNPSESTILFLDTLRRTPDDTDVRMAELCEVHMTVTAQDITDTLNNYVSEVTIQSIDNDSLITLQHIRKVYDSDEQYKNLINIIETGFPATRNAADPDVREYWEVHTRLSSSDRVAFLDRRIIIPSSLRKRVLNILHAAHQGVSGMKRRAEATVYWPGMNASIRTKRYSCHDCNESGPSQSKEPLQPSPPPDWPFQQICADYFASSGHSYLSIVDRFSGWISIYHFPTSHATSSTLISVLRTLFIDHGSPVEISADGGPQFKSKSFADFLTTWGVHYRKSSVEYPQSNGRAELGVKSAKRIILDNTSADGSLDNDRAARAILQYRNTPLPHINLSPSQILFHRQLRDHLPAHPQHYQLHPEWIISAKQREEAFAQRNSVIATRYNATAHQLSELPPGTRVLIQDSTKKSRRWNKSGVIVECLPHRQYHVKLDGSGRITLRNRRFIKLTSHASASPVISPSADTPVVDLPDPNPQVLPPPDTNQDGPEPVIVPSTPMVPATAHASKIPRALKCLAGHNNPGVREQSDHNGGDE